MNSAFSAGISSGGSVPNCRILEDKPELCILFRAAPPSPRVVPGTKEVPVPGGDELLGDWSRNFSTVTGLVSAERQF